jgi:hypothetical protein
MELGGLFLAAVLVLMAILFGVALLLLAAGYLFKSSATRYLSTIPFIGALFLAVGIAWWLLVLINLSKDGTYTLEGVEVGCVCEQGKLERDSQHHAFVWNASREDSCNLKAWQNLAFQDSFQFGAELQDVVVYCPDCEEWMFHVEHLLQIPIPYFNVPRGTLIVQTRIKLHVSHGTSFKALFHFPMFHAGSLSRHLTLLIALYGILKESNCKVSHGTFLTDPKAASNVPRGTLIVQTRTQLHVSRGTSWHKLA